MVRNHKAFRIGYVELDKDHTIDTINGSYSIVQAHDSKLLSRESASSTYKVMDMSILDFYVENLPDFDRSNEVLLKFGINTRDPQDPGNKDNKQLISAVTELKEVADNDFAPGVFNRNVFRNIIFQNKIDLSIDLIEEDKGFKEAYSMSKRLLKDIGGLQNLDVFNGIPYVETVTKIVDAISSEVSSRNLDDRIWSNIPSLEVVPMPGAVYLRSGIYIIYQVTNKEGYVYDISDFIYEQGRIKLANSDRESPSSLPNCLVLSLRISAYGEDE